MYMKKCYRRFEASGGGGVFYGIQKIKGFANNLGCSVYVYR